MTPSGTHLRITSVPYNRDEFSVSAGSLRLIKFGNFNGCSDSLNEILLFCASRVAAASILRDSFSTFIQTFPRRASVFVGNLHVNTTEEDLWKTFEGQVGLVKNARIIRDSKTYVSKVNSKHKVAQ